MADRFRTPYVPTREYQRGSLGDLIARRGEIEAQGALQSGNAWANAVAQIGQIAGGAFQEYGAQKEHKAALQAKELAERPAREMAATKTRLETEKLQREANAAAQAEAKMAASGAAAAEARKSPSRIKALELVAGDPTALKDVEDYFTRKDKAKALEFGDAAAMIRRFGDSDEAVSIALENFIEDGYDPAVVEQIGAQLKDPARRGLIVDSYLKSSPDEGHRALVKPAEKPETRSLEVQLAEALQKGDQAAAQSIRTAIKQAADSGRAPAGSSSENKMWVMRPGPDGKMKSVFIPESQVREGDQPANTRSGEGRPSLGGEKSALGFFNRAKQADEELKGLEDKIASKGLAGQAWMSVMPNFMQTEEGQAYQQAQRAFTEARLRKDSGAAIPETEFANDRKTYFAQPGDSKETAAQKARGRAAVLASLAFQSGRALNEFYGDEAESMIESYKGRQAGSKSEAPKYAPPQMVKYQGKMVPFSSLSPELQAIVLGSR